MAGKDFNHGNGVSPKSEGKPSYQERLKTFVADWSAAMIRELGEVGDIGKAYENTRNRVASLHGMQNADSIKRALIILKNQWQYGEELYAYVNSKTTLRP